MRMRKEWPSSKKRKNAKKIKTKSSSTGAISYVQINMAITVKTEGAAKRAPNASIAAEKQISHAAMELCQRKSILKANTTNIRKSAAENRHVHFKEKSTDHHTYSVTDGLYFRNRFIQSAACETDKGKMKVEFDEFLSDHFRFRQLEVKDKIVSLANFPIVSIKQDREVQRRKKKILLANKDTEELGLLDDVLQYQILSFHVMDRLTSLWKKEMDLLVSDDHQLAADKVKYVRHPYKSEQILDQNLLQTSMLSLDFIQKIIALRTQYKDSLKQTPFTLIDYNDPMEALALAKLNDEQVLRAEIDVIQNNAVAASRGLHLSKKKQELLDKEKSQLYLEQEKLFAEFYTIPISELELTEVKSEQVSCSRVY